MSSQDDISANDASPCLSVRSVAHAPSSTAENVVSDASTTTVAAAAAVPSVPETEPTDGPPLPVGIAEALQYAASDSGQGTNAKAKPENADDDEAEPPLSGGMLEAVVDASVESERRTKRSLQIVDDGAEPIPPAATVTDSLEFELLREKITAPAEHQIRSMSDLIPFIPFNSTQSGKDVRTLINEEHDAHPEEETLEIPSTEGARPRHIEATLQLQPRTHPIEAEQLPAPLANVNTTNTSGQGGNTSGPRHSAALPVEPRDSIPRIPEAFLVQEDENQMVIAGHAEPLLPWWKQGRTRFLLALVCILSATSAVAIGVSFSRRNDTVVTRLITNPPSANPTTAPSLSIVPSPSPSIVPSDPPSSVVVSIQGYIQRLTVGGQTHESLSLDLVTKFQYLYEQYTANFGHRVSGPQIWSRYTVLDQTVLARMRERKRLKWTTRFPDALRPGHGDRESRKLQHAQYDIMIEFMMEYGPGTEGFYNVSNYNPLFAEYVNSNKLKVRDDLNLQGLPVMSVGYLFPTLLPAPGASVESAFRQVLELQFGRPEEFDGVQVGIYQFLMESYTKEFGLMASEPDIFTTCEVTNQELAGRRRLQGAHTNSLAVEFTMHYESRYDIDLEDYPRQFQTYVNNNLERVTEDMNVRFLPVANAQEVVISNTKEPASSPEP